MCYYLLHYQKLYRMYLIFPLQAYYSFHPTDYFCRTETSNVNVSFYQFKNQGRHAHVSLAKKFYKN